MPPPLGSPVAIHASLRWSSGSKRLNLRHYSIFAQKENWWGKCPGEGSFSRGESFKGNNCHNKGNNWRQLSWGEFHWQVVVKGQLFGVNCPGVIVLGDISYSTVGGSVIQRKLSFNLCRLFSGACSFAVTLQYLHHIDFTSVCSYAQCVTFRELIRVWCTSHGWVIWNWLWEIEWEQMLLSIIWIKACNRVVNT